MECYRVFSVKENAHGWNGGVFDATNAGRFLYGDGRKAACGQVSYVREHRHIVETILGCTIPSSTRVWHIDRDLWNNSPSNLYLFLNQSEFSSALHGDLPHHSNLPEIAQLISTGFDILDSISQFSKIQKKDETDG